MTCILSGIPAESIPFGGVKVGLPLKLNGAVGADEKSAAQGVKRRAQPKI
jgi:hypothetical protein